jgi:dienelactone hydrolase
MEIIPIEAVGYGGQPVPASMIVHPGATDHLGIILPGYRHTIDMPDLHYAGLILQKRGADVLRVEYAYPKTDFRQRPQQEQADRLSADVRAACAAGLARRAYKKITLIGKSLGTLAIAHLLEDPRFAAAACVWSTPVLASDWMCAQIRKHLPRSLFIIGTADDFYNPALLNGLVDATKGKALVLPGVHHGLEIEGDIPGTLAALNRIVDAMQEYIN